MIDADTKDLNEQHRKQNQRDQRIKIVSRVVRFAALAVAILAGAMAHFGDSDPGLYLVAIAALIVTVPTFSARRYRERKLRKQQV